MKKVNFPMIADILFYSVCTFTLSFCILRYYRISLLISLLAASMLALATGGIVFLVLYNKNRKRSLTKREQESRDALLLHLALEKPERVRATLLEAYLADGKNAHCDDEELRVDDLPVVPLFSLDPISADEIARLIRRFGRNRFCINCNSLSAEAEKLAVSFGIETRKGDDIYALFSRTGTTPNPLICGEIPRRTVKQKLRRAFSKSNARPFFVSGLLLLLMSLFTFFPVYYIVTGSILLISAIVVRLLGYAA